MNRYRSDLTELLRLATPVVGTRLGVMAMGLTDTVVVGRHSTAELGYVALGWAPSAVVLTSGVGLLAGLQVLTARRLGEGRPELVGRVLRRGLVYAFWLGLAATVVLVALGPAFLRATGIEPDLAKGAGRTLQVFALSMIPALIATACSTFLEALGRATPAMWAMWGANALNLALQLALVPSLGAIGAAWGTFAARLVMAAFLIAWIWRLKGGAALGLHQLPAPDRAEAAEQRRIGYAAGAAIFAETCAFSSMNIVAGWVGGLTVAGWAIVLNVAGILFMVPLGIGAAAQVLVARAHGSDDRRGVARAGAVAMAVAFVIAALLTLAIWIGADFVAGLYTRDPVLLSLAAGALTLACLFFIADALQVVGAHTLRARGDVLVSTLVQIVSYAAVMLPLGWLLALPVGMGLDGIVLAVTVASFISAGLLLGRFWVLANR